MNVTVVRTEFITIYFYLPSRYSAAAAAAAAPRSISVLSKSFICSIFHFPSSKIPLTAAVKENAFMNRRP
jgi:hypothetical protein